MHAHYILEWNIFDNDSDICNFDAESCTTVFDWKIMTKKSKFYIYYFNIDDSVWLTRNTFLCCRIIDSSREAQVSDSAIVAAVLSCGAHLNTRHKHRGLEVGRTINFVLAVLEDDLADVNWAFDGDTGWNCNKYTEHHCFTSYSMYICTLLLCTAWDKECMFKLCTKYRYLHILTYMFMLWWTNNVMMNANRYLH